MVNVLLPVFFKMFTIANSIYVVRLEMVTNYGGHQRRLLQQSLATWGVLKNNFLSSQTALYRNTYPPSSELFLFRRFILREIYWHLAPLVPFSI